MRYRHPTLGVIDVEVGHWDKSCAICGSIATLTYEPIIDKIIGPDPAKKRAGLGVYPKTEITLCGACMNMLQSIEKAIRLV